jgi:hypothetical protein
MIPQYIKNRKHALSFFFVGAPLGAIYADVWEEKVKKRGHFYFSSLVKKTNNKNVPFIPTFSAPLLPLRTSF